MEAFVGWLERVLVMLIKSLRGWTEEDIKILASRQAEVRAFLRGSVAPTSERGMSTEKQKKRWVGLYRDLFGIEIDVEAIAIPPRLPGFDRLIIVARGVTINSIFQVLPKIFSCKSGYPPNTDLDCDTRSVRSSSNGAYAVWCRDQRHPDQENKGLAVSSFSQEECLTLEECLLFGVAYTSQTGNFLEGMILCGGSRHVSGVPILLFGAEHHVYENYEGKHSVQVQIRQLAVAYDFAGVRSTVA